MLFDLWERYRKWILSTVAILFVGISFWIYYAGGKTAHAGIPLAEAAWAAEADSTDDNPGRKSADGSPALRDEGNASGSNILPATAGPDLPPLPPSDTPSPPPLLYVDVKGKVKQPGLYTFPQGARVADAVTKAGGVLPEGDVERINLAELLTDGSAVIIPERGARSACEQQEVHSALTAPASPITANGPSASGETKGVNLNTASLEELMTLPGVGEARAKAILQYRNEKGGFRSSDELKKISGIGDKMYDRMKDQVRVK
ncbi:ComEA family DNA-binding protein [Brevibacillus ruminantium]|uniref:ComEA family DNA-binding protein n=1 Tax=Brevibacillus ruminantium TaxID=2950604 RepID=A0ABY4WDQ7_9BACL|nr:ComEA family DNA-binding protein [Brevibacillus ruminantium]USG63910.1 ComEA family DNA-binding protein [Brevibacillus ruminantium]